MHPVSKLACSFVDKANDELKSRLGKLSIFDFTSDPPSYRLNVWMSTYLMLRPPQLNCMGIQPMGPLRADFDKRNMLLMSGQFDTTTQMSERKLDYYCDSEMKEQMKYDPRYIFHFRKNETEAALAQIG